MKEEGVEICLISTGGSFLNKRKREETIPWREWYQLSYQKEEKSHKRRGGREEKGHGIHIPHHREEEPVFSPLKTHLLPRKDGITTAKDNNILHFY